jgi:hypothetical protein
MGNDISQRGLSKLAAVLVVCLLAILLVGASYVVGYFVCSFSAPWHSERVFAYEWQFELYVPLVRLEERLTGRNIVAGYTAVR